ncbi:MAG: hypothetical protein IPK60_00810 [Sandaracinaceae bacterium]|nr:hypothetical protein [Sandaracinaceae bacterium]
MLLPRPLPITFALALATLLGCSGATREHDDDAGSAMRAPVAVPTAPPAATSLRVARPLARGESVRIPAGVVRAGSRPNSFGRLAANEARQIPIQVSAFSMDRLPYPNDPALPITNNVTRDEAAALCAADNKRLCTELEWERACEGDADVMFPGGNSFDVESCSMEPLSCTSPFDIVSMGVMAAEWTTGMMSGVEAPTSMIRGADAFAEAGRHRCAARRGVLTTAKAETLAFRCCSGDSPENSYPTIETRAMFEDRDVAPETVRAIMSSLPELAAFAPSYRRLSANDVEHTLARGNHLRGWLGEWRLAEHMLVWAPAPGEEAWIITGTSGSSSFVAAVLPMPDGTFLDIGSFFLRDETLPIAAAYNPANPREILFSSCWGCGGESGAVLYREDSTFAIVPR